MDAATKASSGDSSLCAMAHDLDFKDAKRGGVEHQASRDTLLPAICRAVSSDNVSSLRDGRTVCQLSHTSGELLVSIVFFEQA